MAMPIPETPICPKCGGPKGQDYRQPYCKPCHREWGRQYQKTHRKLGALNARKTYWKVRKKTILILGGKCVKCGETDWRVLQINHKNGGGAKEFRDTHPQIFYLRIVQGLRSTEDLELRCANDNIRYEFEVGRRQPI